MINKLFVFIIVTFLITGCATIKHKSDNYYPDNSLMLVSNEDRIDFYYQGQKVGSMTKEQFRSMVNSAEAYNELIKAEKKKRLTIIVEESPWNIVPGSTFKTFIHIYWKNKKGENIKHLKISAEFKIPKEPNISEWREFYRNAAEYSAPILLILCIIFAII